MEHMKGPRAARDSSNTIGSINQEGGRFVMQTLADVPDMPSWSAHGTDLQPCFGSGNVAAVYRGCGDINEATRHMGSGHEAEYRRMKRPHLRKLYRNILNLANFAETINYEYIK